MNWFYFGSLAIAVGLTLFLTDRRRWLTGHFLLGGILMLTMSGYQHLSGHGNAYWQVLLISGRILMTILIPLLLILIGFKFVRYSYRLIQKEGRRFQYALLGIVGVGILITLIATGLNLMIWRTYRAGLILGWAWLMIGFFVYSFFAYLIASGLNHRWRRKKVDYIIVLGAGLLADGRPTRSLRYRLRKAALEYQQQLAKFHTRPTIVLSGGQGVDEVVAESTAMRRYLGTIGIPEDVMVEEAKSTNTWENLSFSAKLIIQAQPFYQAIFVTSNYHVLRGNLISRRLHLQINGVGSSTPWYYWPFATFREYLALIVMNRWINLLVVLILTGIYLAMRIPLFS